MPSVLIEVQGRIFKMNSVPGRDLEPWSCLGEGNVSVLDEINACQSTELRLSDSISIGVMRPVYVRLS